MSKGLETLERLENDECYTDYEYRMAYDIIRKELKALEIIRNKWVNIEVLIQSKTLDDYNTTLCVHDLIQDRKSVV